MEQTVYIRPLRVEDAQVSYAWRNDPRIWKYTGKRPDQLITPEMEKAWVEEVITRPNEKRFSICIAENDRYIGNIFLTDIHDGNGNLHIYIGDFNYWGGKRALQASQLIFERAFCSLNLKNVFAHVRPNNTATLAMAMKFNMAKVGEYFDENSGGILEKYLLTNQKFHEQYLTDLVPQQ